MKTIKDIAQEANVSTGTVDRVIHNRPGVSETTREKIGFLLEKYNFERNRLASTLAYKRRFTLATLIPSPDSDKDFWYEPNEGMQKAIREVRKYMVTTHCFYFDKLKLKSFRKALNEILEINPDGVLLAPFFFKTAMEFAAELSKRGIPYVFMNIDIESQDNLSFIGQDSYQSGLISGKLLDLIVDPSDEIVIVRSRKNVGNHHSIDARTLGFRDFFKKHKKTTPINEVFFEAFNTSEIESVLSEELKINQNINGIFVPSSASFLVGQFLESAKLREIHVVGFDAHEINLKYLKKGVIDFLIDQDPFEQGFMGIKVLFDYLLFKKIPKRIYNSPINIVTKENAMFFKKPMDTELIA